jgi:hypothetical protein
MSGVDEATEGKQAVGVDLGVWLQSALGPVTPSSAVRASF